jgi:hypothetical protein
MLTDNFSELENLRLEKMRQLRQDGLNHTRPALTRTAAMLSHQTFEAREAAGEPRNLS